MEATIYFKDGRLPTKIPISNLDEMIRLLGDSIERIDNPLTKKRLKPKKVRKPTLKELMHSDKDVLKSLAKKVAKEKGIDAPHPATGVEKLAKFIKNNQ